MKLLLGAAITGFAFCSTVTAQTVTPVTDTTDTTTALADQTPSENVRGGAVRERAPGNIISAARARHTELATDRRDRQTSGNTGDGQTDEQNGTSTGSSGSSGLAGLLGGALDSGLLDTLLGGTSGTTGTTGGTGNLTPEAIQLLTDSGFNVGDFNLKQRDDTTSGTQVAKLGSRQQTTTPTTEEEPFRVRWADAMLSTLFTSLVFAFQTPDFISFIEDLIRPIIRPDLTDTNTNKTNNNAANPLRRTSLDGNMRLVFAPPQC